ncbi:MAG: hypothetical protein K0S36_1508 [Nitrosospira multiformis]|nr:hypothetical protein [Nitrosospira multiformis]
MTPDDLIKRHDQQQHAAAGSHRTVGMSTLAALPGVGIYFGFGVAMSWLAAAAATGPLAALLANQFTPAIAESLVQKIKLPHRPRQNALQGPQDRQPSLSQWVTH